MPYGNSEAGWGLHLSVNACPIIFRRAFGRAVSALVSGLISLAASDARAGDAVPASAAAIEHELRSFATVATVLHVGAHPDDENTQLITYFARKRGYRTAYLSLTRGDGGQ